MSRLQWDNIGERFFEAGAKNGVCFPMGSNGAYEKGAAWNGLTAVNESPEGAEKTDLYANDGQYVTLMSAEKLNLTIEAYTYPGEFAACDGSAQIAKGVSIGQQPRKKFGFAYTTGIGNDIDEELGYKIHLVYGCLASPSEKSHATRGENTEAGTFSWSVSTTPVKVEGYKRPAASIEIDSTKVDATKLKQLEDIIYGTDDKESKMPSPEEVIALFGKVSG